MDFGRAVRVARAARGISQKELASAAGVKPSYVSMLERGVRENPSSDVVSRLAAALTMPAAVLVSLGSTRDEVEGMTPSAQSALARAVLLSLADGERPPPLPPIVLPA